MAGFEKIPHQPPPGSEPVSVSKTLLSEVFGRVGDAINRRRQKQTQHYGGGSVPKPFTHSVVLHLIALFFYPMSFMSVSVAPRYCSSKMGEVIFLPPSVTR